MLHLILCGTQSAINIGMILRTAEVFGCRVTLVDTYNVMEDPGNVSRMSDFACGAVERGRTLTVKANYGGLVSPGTRVIEAAGSGRAKSHATFAWQPGDCVLFGNEYSGVPTIVAELAQDKVRIQTPQGYFPKPPAEDPIDRKRASQLVDRGVPILNVAMSAGIIMADASARQANS